MEDVAPLPSVPDVGAARSGSDFLQADRPAVGLPPMQDIAELLRSVELAASRGCFSIAEFEGVGRTWTSVAGWLRDWANVASTLR